MGMVRITLENLERYNMNKFIAVGNMTRDAELRRIADGTAVADFSLAINESYTKKNGEKVENTEFLDFVVWGRAAEALVQYTNKGSQLLVEAKAVTEKWDDKNSGEKRSKVRFKVENFRFLGGNKGGGKPAVPVNNDIDDEEDLDDSIPF